MIITENFFEIEDQTAKLTNAVIESKVCTDFLHKKRMLESDEKAQQLRSSFTRAKEKFEKVEPYGKHAPDYKELQRAARKEKRALDMHPSVMEFRVAQTQLQGLLDEITSKIAQTVSEDIMVESGNPFFNRGKHGGCGNGGSCGC